jgi:hypothetical protein
MGPVLAIVWMVAGIVLNKGNGPTHSTAAEGADADEHPVGERTERCERNDRQAIIWAILAEERDPHKLAVFRDPRVKAARNRSPIYWKR